MVKAGRSRWVIARLRFKHGERGQDVVEYGVLTAWIVIVVLLGVTAFGNEIRPWFEHLAGRLTTVGT